MLTKDAVKALEAAEKENEVLQSRIEEFQMRIEELEISEEKNKCEKKIFLDRQGEIENSLQICIDQLLEYLFHTMKGLHIRKEVETPVINLMQKTYPKETFEVKVNGVPTITSQSKISGSPPPEPPLSSQPSDTSIPTVNTAARRRRRIVTEDEESLLKPLETELRETRKYVSQLESNLAGLKVQLQQTEAISAESSKEIERLLDLNKQYQYENSTTNFQKDLLAVPAALVMVDANIQTIPVETTPIIPAYADTMTNQILSPENHSIEKLEAELGLATKAKVDLLKELSKVNKE